MFAMAVGNRRNIRATLHHVEKIKNRILFPFSFFSVTDLIKPCLRHNNKKIHLLYQYMNYRTNFYCVDSLSTKICVSSPRNPIVALCFKIVCSCNVAILDTILPVIDVSQSSFCLKNTSVDTGWILMTLSK